MALGVLLVSLWTRLERMFVFFPTQDVVYNPEMVGLEYEDVYFETSDGQSLHGWFIPGTTDTTWLWFHGNGGNVGHRVEELSLINRRLGVNQFIFDYRGYGNSQGTPSEKGVYRDSRAALSYVNDRPDVTSEKVIYFGKSLGAAISLELAVEHPPSALVLVAPFSSLKDIAKTAYPQIPFVSWLAGNRYNSVERIPKVNRPSVILHGQQDTIVPSAQGRKLHEAANEPKHFQLLPDAGHNDTYSAGGTLYWETLAQFMDTLAQPAP